MKSEYFELGKIYKTNKFKKLDEYTETLREDAPELEGVEVFGFTILGKTKTNNLYACTKDDSFYHVLLKPKKQEIKNIIKKDLSQMNISTVKLKDLVYDPNLFIPIKSETPLDFVFSQQGGIMPATNYIIIGDPGIGKSSVSIQFAADIKAKNPNKKILFISAEMTEWDMIPYVKRFPLWAELDILFTSKLVDGIYKESLETKLQEGWDLVLTDSFSELADAVRGDINENCSGRDKKSYNDIEKYLVDLMVKHNGGENILGINTAFLSIQQVTKGGDFVGSNKLKHNTTGMLEVRYNKGKERVISVSKNRRGNEYQDLVFTFNEEEIGEPIIYDVSRIERDKIIMNEIKQVRDLQIEEEVETDEWLKLKKELEFA